MTDRDRIIARVPQRFRAHGAALFTAVLVLVSSVVASTLFGSGLRDWAVAQGMDAERGSLIASLLLVGAAVGLTTALTSRVGAARLGALPAMLVVEVVPFLAHASRTGPTPGLASRLDVAGWVLQPLGMLLLGVIAAYVGAGIGVLVRRDIGRLRALWGARRLRWIPAGLALLAVLWVTAGAASTALDAGPASALYRYDVSPSASHGLALASTGVRHDPFGTSTEQPDSHADAAPTAAPFRAGHLDEMQVDGRRVAVFVSGRQDGDRRAAAVLYVLHGYPSDPGAVLLRLQVDAVIDQLVASHRLPPTIAVIPDGNGSSTADAEWGDNPNGNAVETWLVNRVVPAVDARYHTGDVPFRAIAGYSSGGFGAVNLAVRHSGMFRWAGSWSGYFEGRADIFGARAAENSPQHTARRLDAAQRMPLYLGAGDDDMLFLAPTTKFRDELTSLHWTDVRFDVVPGGHGPQAWQLQMVHSLTWLGELWNAAECANTPLCRGGRNG